MFCNSSVGHVDFDFKRRLVRFDYFKKHVVSAVGIFLIVACVFLFAFVVHPVQFDVVAYNLAQAGGNAHEEMCKTNSPSGVIEYIASFDAPLLTAATKFASINCINACLQSI